MNAFDGKLRLEALAKASLADVADSPYESDTTPWMSYVLRSTDPIIRPRPAIRRKN
jgi:hypothetical protein